MDVKDAARRDLQDVLSEYFSVGGHDHDLGSKPAQPFDKVRVAQTRRLEHRQSKALRRDLDRRCSWQAVAPGRPIGLRYSGGDSVAVRQKSLKRGDCEVRSAQETERDNNAKTA